MMSGIFGGLVILAGILIAIFPSVCAGTLVVDQHMLQLALATIFLGPVAILLVMYTLENRSEQPAPTNAES
jgi:uncharacterized membrane protein